MITYNMPAPRPVDTTATYVCNDGFNLIGDAVRSCLEDVIYSGEEPFCLMIRKCVHITQTIVLSSRNGPGALCKTLVTQKMFTLPTSKIHPNQPFKVLHTSRLVTEKPYLQ